MEKITIGRRIYSDEKGSLTLKPGDYGKDGKGVWVLRTPNGITTFIKDHKVIEHEDDTITVSPSIVVNKGYTEIEYQNQFLIVDAPGEYPSHWHGFLKKGVWTDV